MKSAAARLITFVASAAIFLPQPLLAANEYPQPTPTPQKRAPSSYDEAVYAARNLFSDEATQERVRQYGLDLLSFTWEDTGRSKNSALGPNISDMSIQVHVENDRGELLGETMPVVRFPNFDDKSADIRLDKFELLVGNESGRQLKAVTLAEYLTNFRKYLHNPRSWKGTAKSLLAPRDTHVLVSPQISILPVPVQGQATFNPVLFNYQSYEKAPAVLAIVATREGTSATIIDNTRDAFSEGFTHGQRLFFNQNGMRASFTAVRSAEFPAPQDPTGDEDPGLPGANGESGRNMVMLIQVPLKQPRVNRYPGPDEPQQDKQEQSQGGGVDDAVIGHGDIEGPFTEIGDLKIERDPRFPIRVTVQFYKATDVPTLSQDDVASFRQQIDKVFMNADYVGSLVTEGTTLRPTEHNVRCEYPRWWNQTKAWPLKVGDRKMTRTEVESHIMNKVNSGEYGWWYWCDWFGKNSPVPLGQAVEATLANESQITSP